VELFRRSSSLVANPSSQGISLRGLGSTSASRTLVTEDDVPLNDPFGGWIHWQEQPELAISASNWCAAAPAICTDRAPSAAWSTWSRCGHRQPGELRSSYGGEETYDDSLLAQTKRGPWGVLAAGGALGTDGYIQEAPFAARAGGYCSNVHSQNGVLLAEHDGGPLRLFVRGSGFNEARNNGTPYQTNGTRCGATRPAATGKAAQGTLVLALLRLDEHFRQTFSSISICPTLAIPTCTYRCGEIPHAFSHVPTTNWARRRTGASRWARGCCWWPEPTPTTCASGTGADLRRSPRADQSARPPARLRRLR
jgi:hypothetical protein